MITTGRLQELVWPNIAKAGCIILVVMMHSGDHLLELPWAHQRSLVEIWMAINSFIRPLRMPLFFLVSGILASGSILTPGQETERNRLVRPLYLYCVWGVIYQFLIPLNADAPWFTASLNNRFGAIALLVVLSWYMAALAIYYLFTRLTLQIPLMIVLVLCGALSLLATWCEPTLLGHQPKMLRCVLFFVVGVRMKAQVLHFVDNVTPRRIAVLAIGYIVGTIVCIRWSTFLLPVDIIAVATSAALCGVAARHLHQLIRPANWLASRTLPIYLFHFLVLSLLAWIMSIAGTSFFSSFSVGLLYPVLAVPVVIAASLGANAILSRLRVGWLFDLPKQMDLSPLAKRYSWLSTSSAISKA